MAKSGWQVEQSNDESRKSRLAQTPFFEVSLLKLAVMSICTFGLYQIYWFYQNWKLIKARNGSNIWPFARAFFAMVTCYSCFSQIRNYGRTLGTTPTILAGPLAATFIVTNLAYYLPEPFLLMGSLSFVSILPVQALASRINFVSVSGHGLNSNFGLWNWITVVLGGTVFVLASLSTLFPEYFPQQ